MSVPQTLILLALLIAVSSVLKAISYRVLSTQLRRIEAKLEERGR